MFKISHYANSFISIEGNESSLVCDPWIGKTSDNACIHTQFTMIKK